MHDNCMRVNFAHPFLYPECLSTKSSYYNYVTIADMHVLYKLWNVEKQTTMLCSCVAVLPLSLRLHTFLLSHIYIVVNVSPDYPTTLLKLDV